MQNDEDDLLEKVFKRVDRFISTIGSMHSDIDKDHDHHLMITEKIYEELKKCLMAFSTRKKMTQQIKFILISIVTNQYNDGRKGLIHNLMVEFVKNSCRIELRRRIEETFRKLNGNGNDLSEINQVNVGELMMDRLSAQLIYNSAKYQSLSFLLEEMENEWKEMSDKKIVPQRKIAILSSLFANVNSNYSDDSFVELFQNFVNLFKQVDRKVVMDDENLKKEILRFTFIHNMAQHSIPFVGHKDGESSLSKVDIKFESFDDQGEENDNPKAEFITALRNKTLQVLSDIESSVNMSFLNYEKIPTTVGTHFENKFLSQVNETLKYEKVNSILEKELPTIKEGSVKGLCDAFHTDPTLSFIFGTPSISKDGKLITKNSRENLSLKRDDANTYLELVDNWDMEGTVSAIGEESLDVESTTKHLLDSWRLAEFKTELSLSPNIKVKDVLFTSSLFMEPIEATNVTVSSSLPSKRNPIIDLIQIQSVSKQEDNILKLKKEFKFNNMQWMGLHHVEYLRKLFGYDFLDVTNISNMSTFSISVDLDHVLQISRLICQVSQDHQSLCRQIFEENNSSNLWRDFYIDNYHMLNPMKDFSERILENSQQYSKSVEKLKGLDLNRRNDFDMRENQFKSSGWISLMRVLIDKVKIKNVLFSALVDELANADMNSMSEISSIVMKLYYEIHLTLTELVENLKNQPIINLFIILLLVSSIGDKIYSPLDFNFSHALKVRYFLTRFIELITLLLQEHDEELEFQSISKDIQILSFLNVCLIGFRDNIFLSRIKNTRPLALELLSNTILINRSHTESPLLNISKVRLGNNFMFLDRTTGQLLFYNHLKFEYEQSKIMQSIQDNLLVKNMFTDNARHNSHISSSDQNSLEPVNLRSIGDRQVVKNSYKFLDEQLRHIMHEMKPKPKPKDYSLTNEEKEDFEDMLDSLSSVCEVIIVPSEDTEILTRSPSKVKKILLDSLPSLLFEILHTFPDSVNQWISFIVQQTMSFLKTLECCQIISHNFKVLGEKSLQLTKGEKVSFVDMSMFLSMQCSNALFQTIRKNIEPFNKALFEMCLLVESHLLPDYERNPSQNIQNLKTKLEKYALTIQNDILETDYHSLIQLIRKQVGEDQFIGITDHLQVGNEEGLIELLKREMLSLKKHIIRERLLDYHLCMNQFYGEDLESFIPLSETINYLGFPISSQESLRPNHWREQLFLSLDFEEYAEILQQVLDNCPKGSDENGELSTFIMLQQLILVLGNYPFHKLVNTTDNDSIPYLHPIIHSSVVSKIASDPIIQQEMVNMKPVTKLALGRLYDNLVRKCCQAKMEFNTNFIKLAKRELVKSLHQSYNLAQHYQTSNAILSDKLHNLLLKNYTRSED